MNLRKLLVMVGALGLWAAACSDMGTEPQDPLPPAPGTVSIAANRDNSIFEPTVGSPPITSNALGDLYAGTTAGRNSPVGTDVARVRRALIRFNVAGSGIPAGATVDSVTLTLRVKKIPPSPVNSDFTIHRVLAEWGEGASGGSGAGAAPTPNDATWINRLHPSTAWTTPGGDFDTTASATTPVTGLGSYTWRSTTVMVSDVQGWLDIPGSNFGWILRGGEADSSTARVFDSRGVPGSANPNGPRLTIHFTTP